MKSYILNYSKRHSFPANQVEGNEILHHCAIVEDQVGKGVLTLEQARYIIIEAYPHTNCITGIYSVLSLVLPYEGCWRELKGATWKFRYEEKRLNA
jgi:hypothetical protein